MIDAISSPVEVSFSPVMEVERGELPALEDGVRSLLDGSEVALKVPGGLDRDQRDMVRSLLRGWWKGERQLSFKRDWAENETFGDHQGPRPDLGFHVDGQPGTNAQLERLHIHETVRGAASARFVAPVPGDRLRIRSTRDGSLWVDPSCFLTFGKSCEVQKKDAVVFMALGQNAVGHGFETITPRRKSKVSEYVRVKS